MHNKAKPARDPFTFSLGGMEAIASFAVAPAIANDRIIQDRDDQPDQNCDDSQGDDSDGSDHSWRSRLCPVRQAA